MVARLFARFRQFGCFYFKFSMAFEGLEYRYSGFGFTTLDEKVLWLMTPYDKSNTKFSKVYLTVIHKTVVTWFV